MELCFGELVPHQRLCQLEQSRKRGQQKSAPHKVKCASWVQRHAGVLTGKKRNHAGNAGNKNREPHCCEIRDLGAAAYRWLGWTKMNPQPNLQPKNSGFMRLSRFVLSEKSPLNKNETTFHPPGGELFSFSFLVDFMRLFLFWCQPASNPHCSFFHSDRDTQYTAFAFRKLLKTSM